MTLDRRCLIKAAAAAPLIFAQKGWAQDKPDYTLRIARGHVDLGPGHSIPTTLYNDQFPGPLFRFKEGQRAVIDIHNETDTPELVHWHGQTISVAADGAAEEGSPFVPAHGSRRVSFTPGPSGFRFAHTHVAAGGNLNKGTYTGQIAPVYIEPKHNPGAYDREVFLVLKEFEPSLSRGGDMDMDFLTGSPVKDLKDMGAEADKRARDKTKGFEVGYKLFGINGKMLGHGEPIRVKVGERVLFHIVNASATEIRSLALPGHAFRVVALDGNAVPKPADVPVLWLGTAERISAIVQMDAPGVWILGDLADDDRGNGMGTIIEYAGHSGKPVWTKPKDSHWDYSIFGHAGQPAAPEQTFTMTIVKNNAALNGFNQWTINGNAFSMESMQPSFNITKGKRYRIKMRNASDDIHPVHLHRHSFELVRVGGKQTAGIMKDVVMVGGFQEAEFDFIADNPGRTLFHCHQQLHMDFGFMAIFNYI